MLFKNSVRTSKRTPHFTITEINWLTLFKFNVTMRDNRRRERYFDFVTFGHIHVANDQNNRLDDKITVKVYGAVL
jgi:hypothetical protein